MWVGCDDEVVTFPLKSVLSDARESFVVAGRSGKMTASEGADLKARPLSLGHPAVSNDGQVLHVISKTHRKS